LKSASASTIDVFNKECDFGKNFGHKFSFTQS